MTLLPESTATGLPETMCLECNTPTFEPTGGSCGRSPARGKRLCRSTRSHTIPFPVQPAQGDSMPQPQGRPEIGTTLIEPSEANPGTRDPYQSDSTRTGRGECITCQRATAKLFPAFEFQRTVPSMFDPKPFHVRQALALDEWQRTIKIFRARGGHRLFDY